MFCSSDPASHPLITKKESDYLHTEMGQLKRQSGLPLTPWKKILKSAPVLALLIAQVSLNCFKLREIHIFFIPIKVDFTRSLAMIACGRYWLFICQSI